MIFGKQHYFNPTGGRPPVDPIVLITEIKVRNFYIHPQIIHEGAVIVRTFLPISEISLY